MSKVGSISYKNSMTKEEEAGAEEQREWRMLTFELSFLTKGRRRKLWETMKMEDEEMASPHANIGQVFSLLVQRAVAIEDTQELWLSVFGFNADV